MFNLSSVMTHTRRDSFEVFLVYALWVDETLLYQVRLMGCLTLYRNISTFFSCHGDLRHAYEAFTYE